MSNFTKKYSFGDIEKKIQNIWNKYNIYKWDDKESRENNYVVDTPPPTVSGNLHIGHVFSYTHTDFIVRFQRMMGKNIFYPIGFDDNGLPTERLVEKKKNIKASKMDREEFVEECRNIIDSEEKIFRELFNNIALSVDWDLEYSTISDRVTKIAQLSFLDLIKKNQIYRKEQPVLWDSVDCTALAQADIEDKIRTSYMYDISFKTLSGENIVIATTRPEMLPACGAIFFHPDDKRYKHLENQYATTPLFDIQIPIKSDDKVDPEKGSGLVMCCTFGDSTDVYWWRKHDLQTRIIIDKYGKIKNISELFSDGKQNDNIVEYSNILEGLKVKDARNKIVELLKQNNLILAEQEIEQTVKCAERSGAPLEILTTKQWFVKTVDHKEKLREKVMQINWHPENMRIKIENWIDSISWDWCISRQRYFGVTFPVWYSKRAGEEGKILFAEICDLPVDPMKHLPKGYSADEVVAETDIMDTWFTSSVSPQINSHAINADHALDYNRHSNLFPADLRPQAHEIIRTWTFYTMLKSLLHEDVVPWHNIMLSGWCVAKDKTKMSKSKGNIIEPGKLLNEYGADVIRYWSANSSLGADTIYSEDVVKNGKRFLNKIWNAGKFINQHVENLENINKNAYDELVSYNGMLEYNKLSKYFIEDFDIYLINLLKKFIENVTNEFKNYQYSKALSKLETFFWSVFCDNYIEIVKTRAYNEQKSDNDAATSAIVTMYFCFNFLLKTIAPFMPFVTETVFQLLYCRVCDIDNVCNNVNSEDDKRSEFNSIHLRGGWCSLDENLIDKHQDKSISEQSEMLVSILDLVRKIKSNDQLSMKKPIAELYISNVKFNDSLIVDLKNVTSSDRIIFMAKNEIDDLLDKQGGELSYIHDNEFIVAVKYL